MEGHRLSAKTDQGGKIEKWGEAFDPYVTKALSDSEGDQGAGYIGRGLSYIGEKFESCV